MHGLQFGNLVTLHRATSKKVSHSFSFAPSICSTVCSRPFLSPIWPIPRSHRSLLYRWLYCISRCSGSACCSGFPLWQCLDSSSDCVLLQHSYMIWSILSPGSLGFLTPHPMKPSCHIYLGAAEQGYIYVMSLILKHGYDVTLLTTQLRIRRPKDSVVVWWPSVT